MKFSRSSFAATVLSGSFLLSSLPAYAADVPERCLRVTGREQQRCISINNQSRIRLRAATLETRTRAQIRRADRVELRQKTEIDNVLDRVQGLNLDEIRRQSAAQGSQRRRLQNAIENAQNKCNGLTGIRRAICNRQSFRTDIAE